VIPDEHAVAVTKGQQAPVKKESHAKDTATLH
jgi:hypothetical protein